MIIKKRVIVKIVIYENAHAALFNGLNVTLGGEDGGSSTVVVILGTGGAVTDIERALVSVMALSMDRVVKEAQKVLDMDCCSA